MSNAIINSKHQYPDWLRNHIVFKEMKKIDKIFPRIGLPNFKEPSAIMNAQEAMADATRLGSRFRTMIANAVGLLNQKLVIALDSKEKDRNEICAKTQSAINLFNVLNVSLSYADYAKVIDGKVIMRLRADIFNEGKNPTFRKDEALLRVMNKVRDICTELKIEFGQIDQLAEFKDFSRSNVPNKKYVVVFSSSGEDGLWDIGTISMRGITSCQAWNAPQSRGLIGSISSKYVGVMYLASDQDIPGYGSKMLHRAMVRFVINKTTKRPALVIDRMYPSENVETVSVFKKLLAEKSKLDVYYTNDRDANGNPLPFDVRSACYLPDEPARKFLKQGEFSYMDNQIPVLEHTPKISKAPANITVLTTEFKTRVATDINAVINNKRTMYQEAKTRQDALRAEYDAAKAKWEAENTALIAAGKSEEERPKFELTRPAMDPELAAFGKGGIINLMKHCDKKHGVNNAGKLFADMILNSFTIPELAFETKEEYHRKYLMGFLKDQKSVKEASWKLVAAGTWMKSFPKCAERLHSFVMSQMKAYVVGGIKDMIKQSN